MVKFGRGELKKSLILNFMKIGTREATRYLRVLLGIYPYFHIYCSIQVKFGVEDLYLVFFSVLVSFVPSSTKITILTLYYYYYYYYYCHHHHHHHYYSLSPLCTVFTFLCLKQTMFMGYAVLQLFCSYNLCCM